MQIRTLLFDFGDTLVQTSSEFNYETALRSLHQSLGRNGVSVPYEDYRKVHIEIRDRVYARNSLREIVFGVRVSEALNRFGYSFEATDPIVIEATEAFMEPWIKARTMNKHVPTVLQSLKMKHKLGIVSNFSYTPAVWKTLEKFELTGFFDAVVVSADVGWRKPSPRIFRVALRAMGTSAAETAFIGDELDHDIMGAKNVGMRTILLVRSSTTQSRCKVEPDEAINNMKNLQSALRRLETEIRQHN